MLTVTDWNYVWAFGVISTWKDGKLKVYKG
jgi:hypothetical protein